MLDRDEEEEAGSETAIEGTEIEGIKDGDGGAFI